MLVETAIMIVGLIAGIAAVQLWSLRMSGVLVVPLLAIYGLYDHDSLPVFILSTLAAYIALYVIKKRSLLYGRGLLLAGILSGALVPVIALALSIHYYGTALLNEIEFVGTILPGVAAYNLHQLSVDRRLDDVILSLFVLAGLMLLGVFLLDPLATPTDRLALPPVLHSQDSDIARRLGIAAADPGYRSVVSLSVGATAVIVGLVIAETARSRWGFRVDGIIGVPLLAIFTLQDAAALLLYLILIPLTYLLVDRFEAQTGLYGRITLAIALLLALVLALPIVPLLSIQTGLIAFFTALFAGIAVYNFRRIPTSDRFESIVVTGGALAVAYAIVRPFITPAPGGLLQTVHPVHAGIGFLLVISAAWICFNRERIRPELSGPDIQ